MLCISTAYAVLRCPSVCASVLPSVMFEILSPSGSHAIVVFLTKVTLWHYSDGKSPNGASNARGYEK